MRLELPCRSSVVMFELGAADGCEVSPALGRVVDSWKQAGIAASGKTVPGSAFWQTQEIELAPALIEHSLLALEKFA
jgi:hypothetical protein